MTKIMLRWMRHAITVSGLCVCLIFASEPTTAQIDIDYDDVIEGTISEAVPENRYRFQGEAGDVIIIEMRSADRTLENLLDAPRLILQASSENVIADTFTNFPQDDALLIAELPQDDTYTIIAGRDEQMVVPSVGAYTLRLTQAQHITPDEEITATLSTDDTAHYYFLRTDATFSLSYAHLDGTYFPQVTVGHLNNDPNIVQDVLAVVYGHGLTQSTLGDFNVGNRYLIMLNQNPLDYYSQPASATYTLTALTEN